MGKFVNISELINGVTDIEKKEPSVYIITSNRSDGKTTSYYKDIALKNWIEKKEQFALIYRTFEECKDNHLLFTTALELLDVDIKSVVLKSKKISGCYYAIFFNGEICGFAFSMNNAEKIKKYSACFNQITTLAIDEYQSESGRYAKNEIMSVMSIIATVARKKDCATRFVKLFLLGNYITNMNPWLIYYGITDAKKDSLIKRKGCVAFFRFNKETAKEIEKNNMYDLNNRYNKSLISAEYLFNSEAFIKNKITGKFRYIATLETENFKIGIREYNGFLHCGNADMSVKNVFTTVNDFHNIDKNLFTKKSYLMICLCEYYDMGCLYFKNLAIKNEIMLAIGRNIC